MERIVEPELMEDEAQALAYAGADFDRPHTQFIELFRAAFPSLPLAQTVIDLGCGPGDIALRFARAFPSCVVHGVDGAAAMLRAGEDLLARAEPQVHSRVQLLQGMLPGAAMPLARYDAIISNSLLHQLHDPQVLWQSVQRFAAPGAPVFIMDLRRPATTADAERLRERYVGSEPEILQRDFYNSLFAAFEPDEIIDQLAHSGLAQLKVSPMGDRHVTISGRAA